MTPEPDLPPVNWEAERVGFDPTSEKVGGPRHYKGSEVGARLPWNCPACGKENIGRLVGEGCEACGSGVEAAKHVGVPEFVRRSQQVVDDTAAAAAFARPLRTGTTDAFAEAHKIAVAFHTWISTQSHSLSLDVVGLLGIAFAEGWRAARGGSVDGPEEIPTPAADAEMPEAVLTGSAQGRTLIAALQYFADQVLAQHPEEIDSGEWLRPEDIPALIEEIRGRYV